MRNKLTKLERIRLSKDFQRILKKGERESHRYYALFFIDNDLGFNRFGIITPKRIFKKAVQRSRVKRIIREFIRQNKNIIRFQSTDCIISAKYSILDIDFITLSRNFFGSLKNNH